MLYMLEVYLLFSIPILVLAGMVLLAMVAWTGAKHYARAAMRRIATARSSAVNSHNRPVESFRVA